MVSELARTVDKRSMTYFFKKEFSTCLLRSAKQWKQRKCSISNNERSNQEKGDQVID